MLAVTWVFHDLWTKPWDWAGIATHLSIEEISGGVVFAILWWGRNHAKHKGFLHRFAHNFKLQFALDMVIDVMIAVTTIQVMHL